MTKTSIFFIILSGVFSFVSFGDSYFVQGGSKFLVFLFKLMFLSLYRLFVSFKNILKTVKKISALVQILQVNETFFDFSFTITMLLLVSCWSR